MYIIGISSKACMAVACYGPACPVPGNMPYASHHVVRHVVSRVIRHESGTNATRQPLTPERRRTIVGQDEVDPIQVATAGGAHGCG
jgi:hypothetical protein